MPKNGKNNMTKKKHGDRLKRRHRTKRRTKDLDEVSEMFFYFILRDYFILKVSS